MSYTNASTPVETRAKLKPLLLLLPLFVCPFLWSDEAEANAEVQQWDTVTLSFEGPESSEDAEVNPFVSYRLLVRFTHENASYVVRGFYAADGDAAESGADSGNVWQARFTPHRIGEWSYEASLHRGDLIAIDDDPNSGTPVELSDASGSFKVASSTASRPNFRARGRIVADNGYFRFAQSGDYWLKGGADSPENFLAYADFDGTYRYSAQAREGEAGTTDSLHHYAPHLKDFKQGDPTWQNGKGKGILGAINYLASTGMNAIYFLTMNIEGDGKDVWPYRSHDDFTRFDCSKLDQWEIVFRHMQRKGILMHVVTQETENERLLDDGETGTLRKLYYRELIARFGHHLGLVWNLGEENGPADFSPNGQTSEQQRTMPSYFKASDPYKHPVVIHTHSIKKQKDELLPPLLGHEPLDGLSLQVHESSHVHEEVIKWRKLAHEAGQEWLITMDEIGRWHTGVVPDAVDPDHDELRRQVLWGSLMAGAAGVEWYFGAHYEGNDLNTEDWRSRANMWEQTRYALDFFSRNLPYWEMSPSDALTPDAGDYCFAKREEVYAIYVTDSNNVRLDLEQNAGEYGVRWFRPKTGGTLQIGSLSTVSGPGEVDLGSPPNDRSSGDWVVLINRI